jgi:hypothetical protein
MKILIENTKERFKKIIFIYDYDDEVLPEDKKQFESIEIKEVFSAISEPIYDSKENKVVEYSDIEFVKDPSTFKIKKIQELSEKSFSERQKILPDYKLLNAGIGIYTEEEIKSFNNTIQAFRDEFYRVKDLIENSTSKEEIDNIKILFPTSLI